MILGKRFSRLKKSLRYKAQSLYLMEDGTEFRPHRKLNMMLTLLPLGGINQRALDREQDKILAQISIATSKRHMASVIARHI